MAEALSDKEIALNESDFESPEAYQAYCLMHSTAHVMAAAIQQMYPDAQFAIGPPTKDGTNRFYYDMSLPVTISVDDLPAIEEKMREIVKANLPLKHETWDKQKALDWFGARNQTFKLELITNIEDDTVSIYQLGDFVDLCHPKGLSDCARRDERGGRLRGAHAHAPARLPLEADRTMGRHGAGTHAAA